MIKKFYKDPLFVGLIVGMVLMYGIFTLVPEGLGLNDLIKEENSRILFKLLLSIISGAAIGYEREKKNRPAGLRTHSLVCLGATIVMLIPYQLTVAHPELDFDFTRLGAQVISGIGFLGAGTIIRTGGNVRGLTTAATLWVAGIIGLAIGSGVYFASITAVILVMLVLKQFASVKDRKMIDVNNIKILFETNNMKDQLSEINQLVDKNHLHLRRIEVIENEGDQLEIVRFNAYIYGDSDINHKKLINELFEVSNIIKVEYF